MSLLNRQRAVAGETPDQTLARLNRATQSVGQPLVMPPGAPRFTAVRLSEGYDMDEVDAFIDGIDQCTADEVHEVRFSTVRLKSGYAEDEVDRFLDDYATRLCATSTAKVPAQPPQSPPVEAVATTSSGTRGQRLAAIPQQRWRRICVMFWLAVVVWSAIGVGVAALQPDGGSVALWVVMGGAMVAACIFWMIGVTRTGQMDPAEWTDTQYSLKWVADHLGEGSSW